MLLLCSVLLASSSLLYYFMINSSFLFLNIIDEDSQPITHGVCRKGVVEGSVCSVRR